MTTRPSLQPLMEDVKITAQINDERKVGGLLAYRCTESGHIFFVRKVDVEADPELRYAL